MSKKWFCKRCGRWKESEDNIKEFYCPGCLKEMKEDVEPKFKLIPKTI
jgi:predicted amidophosphoribosyltransferase